MSIAPAPAAPRLTEASVGTDERRVRQQARDAAALMAFSAAVSLGTATFLVLLATVARQA